MRYVIYNPLSIHALSIPELAKTLRDVNAEEDMRFIRVDEIDDGFEFMKLLSKGDDIVVSGGDGTFNRLVNKCHLETYNFPIYFHKAGNSNDFMRDIGDNGSDFAEVSPYLKKLPTVTFGDEELKFLNNVGFGIDGMVSLIASHEKMAGKLKINYKSILIKCLLFKYKPVSAVIEVDGEKHLYKKVYVASTMNGRYYGGGIKQTPDQDRSSDEVSLIVWHSINRLSGFFFFHKLLKAKHIPFSKHASIIKGKNISVRFDKPTDIQIDGECIHGIYSYKVKK